MEQQLKNPLDDVSQKIVEAVIQNLVNRGLILGQYTTTNRDLLVKTKGVLIYNTTTNKLNFCTGTAWEAITSV